MFQKILFFIWVFTSFSNMLTSSESKTTIIIKPEMVEKINPMIAAASSNQTFLFTKGTYILKKGLLIQNKSYLKFRAEKDTFLILNDMDSSVFQISESDNIEISGFHAKHRNPLMPNETCNGAVIYVVSSHDITLLDLELNGSGMEGVTISSSTSVFIRNSWIHHNSVAGILLERFADHIFIENNKFEHNPIHTKSTFLEDTEWNKYIHFKNNKYDAKPVKN